MDGSGPAQEAAYCTVTVVCGVIRRDVALPAQMPSGALVPGLIRLLEPVSTSTAERGWLLAPLGRQALGNGDTLSGAGVLDGDVLLLRPDDPAGREMPSGGSLRDQVEDMVTAQGRRWTPDTSAGFDVWVATLAGALLLVPAGMSGGGSTAGVAAAVAVALALVAIAAADRSVAAAAAALGVGCAWAGLAGWTGWTGSTGSGGSLVSAIGGVSAGSGTTTAVGLLTAVSVAAGTGFLLAVAALAVYPMALVHAVAAATVVLASVVVLALVSTGLSLPAISGGTALTAVLVIGAGPRLAFAIGGLSAVSELRDAQRLSDRIARVDLVLIGLLTGLSVVAVLGALPAALSADGRSQLLAGGIGLGLLLRSRVFSQIPHVLGPRIAGWTVLAGLWTGLWRVGALPGGMLIVGTALVGGALAARLPSRANPVARARAGRFLDVAELALVVAAVVLTAGVFGLFDWIGSVAGAR